MSNVSMPQVSRIRVKAKSVAPNTLQGHLIMCVTGNKDVKLKPCACKISCVSPPLLR